MADRRGARAASRCAVPVRSVHPPQDDVPAGEGGIHAVLHLLHVAQRPGRTAVLPGRNLAAAASRFLPPAFLRQHPRHQSPVPADLGPRRLPDPRRAGRDGVRPVGDV
ncbi:hypothetical protein G6F32_015447 [Rhizopus arrhizus]|nr:hypothetical protein G6F32_015447 [Rhizopus arrhizus]